MKIANYLANLAFKKNVDYKNIYLSHMSNLISIIFYNVQIFKDSS